MKIIRNEMFLTTNEAAQLLGVSARTIRRWLSSENKSCPLHPIKNLSGRPLFRKTEVDALLDEILGSPGQPVSDIVQKPAA